LAEVRIVFYPYLERNERQLHKLVCDAFRVNRKDTESGRVRLEFRYSNGEVITEVPLVPREEVAADVLPVRLPT